MALTKERRNEIAYLLLLRRVVGDEEVKLKNLRRMVGAVANEIGVPRDEFAEFTEEILAEYIHEELAPEPESTERD